MATTIRDNSYTAKPQLAAYRYDQLNRIKQMQTYQSITSNAWGATSTNAYKEVYAYDANGNIKTLERYDGAATPVKIDNLTYGYNKDGNGKLINNRLNYIADPIPDGTSTYDVDGQSLNNYGYDAIGNLKSDVKERIGEIKWNVYGKVSEIIRERNTTNTASDLAFVYDAMGNRVCKIEKPYNYLTNPGGWLYTFYVRDASGNIMSTYTKTGDQIEDAVITLDEVMLYGSNRLGVRMVNKTIAQLEAETSLYLFNRRLGLKRYEMTNHLGNVLTTFTDRKQQVQSSGVVTGYKVYLASSQDYYPFGMGMNERSWNASSYRFGFNGKEMDNETYGDGNEYDYGFRIYNPRIGRFLSVDPLTKDYPELTTYQFASNTPIQAIDLDGLEAVNPAMERRLVGDELYAKMNNIHNLVSVGSYVGRSMSNAVLTIATVPQVVLGNIISGGELSKFPIWGIPHQVDNNWNLVSKREWLYETQTTEENTEMYGATLNAIGFRFPAFTSRSQVVTEASGFTITSGVTESINYTLTSLTENSSQQSNRTSQQSNTTQQSPDSQGGNSDNIANKSNTQGGNQDHTLVKTQKKEKPVPRAFKILQDALKTR